jgi:hypothetical protein
VASKTAPPFMPTTAAGVWSKKFRRLFYKEFIGAVGTN